MADGFRAIRFHTVPPASTEFDVRKMIDAFVAICAELREGVGPNGDFILDAHTRLTSPTSRGSATSSRLMRRCSSRIRCVDRRHHGVYEFAPARDRAARGRRAVRRLTQRQPAARRAGVDPLLAYVHSELRRHHELSRARGALRRALGAGLVPHFTAPLATSAVIHSVLAFPGVVVTKYSGGYRSTCARATFFATARSSERSARLRRRRRRGPAESRHGNHRARAELGCIRARACIGRTGRICIFERAEGAILAVRRLQARSRARDARRLPVPAGARTLRPVEALLRDFFEALRTLWKLRFSRAPSS